MSYGWAEVEDAVKESSDFLRIKTGQVRLHVLTPEPYNFKQLYLADAAKKAYNLPFDTEIAGFELRDQHAFVVLVGDEQKLWVAGRAIAKKLVAVKNAWGSLTSCDLVVERKGEGRNTRWEVTAVPPAKKEYPAVKLDPAKIIVFSKVSELDGVKPPASTMTPNQAKLISSICEEKKMSMAACLTLLKNKMGKDELDDLTSAEASEFISVLKG